MNNVVYEKEIGLICSVRDATIEDIIEIENFIMDLARRGLGVYCPTTDNPYQTTDKIGIRICAHNAEEFLKRRKTSVLWKEASKGSHFDLGMVFMLLVLSRMLKDKEVTAEELAELLKNRRVMLANPNEVKITKKKSFNNILHMLHQLSLSD